MLNNKRFVVKALLLLGAVLLGSSGVIVNPVHAANPTATIDIDLSNIVKTIPAGFSGVNLEFSTRGLTYQSSALSDKLKQMDVGWLRYYGGTSSQFYDWKMGQIPNDMLNQFTEHYFSFPLFAYGGRQIDQGKGGMSIANFNALSQNVGAAGAIVAVNVMTDSVQSAADLVKYAKDNNIKVAYWELGNEPFAYFSSFSVTPTYIDPTDYINRAKAYNDAIKAADPTAKTVICGSLNSNWATTFQNYTNKYWDAVLFHDYTGGNGKNYYRSLLTANDNLNEISDKVNQDLVATNWSDIPVISTEYNVGASKNNPPQYNLRNTLYGGIYVAEYLARLSKNPNMQYMGLWNSIDNLIGYSNDYRYDSMNAYEQNTTLDTSGLDFGMYLTAPAIAFQIANGAINNSSALYATTVTGGPTVNITGGTMPAIYAQSYKGNDGKQYVLITNKSDTATDVTITSSGTPFTHGFNETYVTGNYTDQNTSASPNTVQLQTAFVPDTFTLSPYSVVRLDWNANNKRAPGAPLLTSGKLKGNDSVDLNWTANPSATGYKVGVSSTAGGPYTYTDVGNVTFRNVTGLTPGSTNYFAVQAYNTTGSSPDSNEFVFTDAGPPVPDLESAEGGNGRVRLKWQSSAGATGYSVHWGTSSGSYSNSATVGNATGYDIGGLTNGTTYYFAVHAFNAAGHSSNSNEISGVPQAAVPYAPHNLTASQGTTSPVLQWLPSYSNEIYETFESGSGNWNAPADWSSYQENGYQIPTKSLHNSNASGTQIATYTGNGFSQQDTDMKFFYKTDSWTGSVGMVARYQDADNYYGADLNGATGDIEIFKMQGGVKTVLDHQTIDTSLKTIPGTGVYNLAEFKVIGDQIAISIGPLNFSVTDSSLTGPGTFGLYTNDQAAYFDKIDVTYPNPETYNVLRSTDPSSGYATIAAGVTGTTYTDSGLTAGQLYYYEVQAVENGVPSRTYSLPATARP